MATWNSRGLRGSTLEDLVNRTNEQYAQKKLALIQKIPTPITPVRMDKENRHITLAYFEQRSTVDYIGVVQGIPVCFDAKECCVDTFPLSNIHPHQVTFMEAFEQQGGIAFFVIFFSQFSKRRTQRGILSAEAGRISGSLFGGDSAGSQNAGLTILRISTIIFSVLQSSMVAY